MVQCGAPKTAGGGAMPPLTVFLDLDECLLHSQFEDSTGQLTQDGGRRQQEARPELGGAEGLGCDAFRCQLEDGDSALVRLRPGLYSFLRALSAKCNVVVYTAALESYARPVLNCIDPTGSLLPIRLFRSSCRAVNGAFLKDLSGALQSDDLSRVVLVDNNPLSFVCQPNNGVLVTSFYNDASDTALSAVLDLILDLVHVRDVRPFLRNMFHLGDLLMSHWSHVVAAAHSSSCSVEARTPLPLPGTSAAVAGESDMRPQQLVEVSPLPCSIVTDMEL